MKTKILITSNIMREAHKQTKIMKKQFPEINYRTQLGIEISNLIKQSKENYIKVLKRNKLIKMIITTCNNIDNSNTNIWGNDLELVSNMFRRFLCINNFAFMKTYTAFTLANDVMNRYGKNIRRYI